MTKLHGIYLGIGTLAISILTDDFIVILEPLTGGVRGLYARQSRSRHADRSLRQYGAILLMVLLIVVGIVLVYRNLLRSPLGRPFAAVRDSEVSARAMGVNVARTKAVAFGISSGITGLAGALIGHFTGISTRDVQSICRSSCC